MYGEIQTTFKKAIEVKRKVWQLPSETQKMLLHNIR